MTKIHGTKHAETIQGTIHDDDIHGMRGGDIIRDSLHQIAASNDRFFGNAGDDFIISLSGKDYLNGGHGDDIFDGANLNDLTVVGGAGHDDLILPGHASDYHKVVFNDHIEYHRDGYHIEAFGVEEVTFRADVGF